MCVSPRSVAIAPVQESITPRQRPFHELVELGGRYAEMYATWLAHLDPHGSDEA